jgi:hydrogenase expression/formation protein HypC
MCLALPARVITVDDDDGGVVELGGVRRRVSFALIDGVCVGDHVIIHVGYALTRLDTAEADATLEAFAAGDTVNTVETDDAKPAP